MVISLTSDVLSPCCAHEAGLARGRGTVQVDVAQAMRGHHWEQTPGRVPGVLLYNPGLKKKKKKTSYGENHIY